MGFAVYMSSRAALDYRDRPFWDKCKPMETKGSPLAPSLAPVISLGLILASMPIEGIGRSAARSIYQLVATLLIGYCTKDLKDGDTLP